MRLKRLFFAMPAAAPSKKNHAFISSFLFTCGLGALVLGGRGTLPLLLLDDGFGSHR